MCKQERASLIAIATNLLVNGYIVFLLLEMSAEGTLDGPDATTVWAQTAVWAIPATIAMVALLHTVVALATRGRDFGPAVDERDRLFQVRGMCMTTVVFSIGLVVAMIGLANGWTPLAGLLVIYYSASLGDLLGNGLRIACYRF